MQLKLDQKYVVR